jgi:N-acetylmuramoyl-L-alanine amidase
MKSKLLWPGLLAACALITGCAGVNNTSHTFRTVVIDAGHGGHDSGTTSRRGGAEKMATLAVAQRLAEKLHEAGFHTVMTRDSDVFVPLGTRAQISNSQRNAIFVSIHFNDSRKRDVHGIEVYYKAGCAREIADRIEGKLRAVASDRGVHAANYCVLRLNRYPAVLVECGFLSNPAEARRTVSDGYREDVAQKIAEAIVEQRYGENSKREAKLAARH